MFLISETLLPNLHSSTIEPSYRSDHSFPVISLKFNDFKNGKGLWKFNSSLLHDIQYLEIINKTISEIKKQYALPIYNIDHLSDIPDAELQFTINDQLFLEILLMAIRGKTISYASYKKRQERKRETELIEEIKQLESQVNTDFNFLDQKKQDLENIRLHRIKGSVIRSSVKWLVNSF